MKTFDELGIPFPLYTADVESCGAYVGRDTCSLCEAEDAHVFTLEDDGELVITCGACGTINGCRRDDEDEDAPECTSCGTELTLPESPILVCYHCLRAGRAQFPKNTEVGLATVEAAGRGFLGPSQGLTSDQLEVVEVSLDTHRIRDAPAHPYPPHERAVRWFAARLAPELILELTRTPSFIGQEIWPFCCARPAIYLGTWERDDAPPGRLGALVTRIVQAAPGRPPSVVHAYRCGQCDALHGHGER